ncbi:polycomb, partial [Brachionus plicatilis]
KATRIKTKIRNNLVQVSSTKSSPNNQQQTQKSCTNFNSVLYQICKPDASMAIQGFSQNYRCPFCYICLDNFVNLINHLKGIHSRFICRDFLTNNQQIDIIPDDLFDGSFSGDLIDYKRNEYLGYCKCRGKPTKRAPGLLFCVFNNFYGKMLRKNGDIDVALSWHSQSLAPNNSPQNRIYYHSLTNLAKKLNSDEDSEVEQDWLEVIKQRNFDKLEDVNQGQKDIMNLWNKHCLKHNLIARSNVFINRTDQ